MNTRFASSGHQSPRTCAELKIDIPSSEPAVASSVETVKKVMQLVGLNEEWIRHSELSLQEALRNSYLHGNRCDPDKNIRIRCLLSAGKVELHVEDEGRGYVPKANYDTTEPTERNGKGLFLIHRLMHSVKIQGHGNHIVMCLMKG